MHNPIQKISLLIYEAFGSLRSARSWLPLFYFWLICAASLLALTRFAELPFSERVAGWMMSLFGRESVEYPRLYLQLPDIQRKLYLLLAASVGTLFTGTSLLHLIRFHTRGTLVWPRPWLRSAGRLPGHVLINFIGLLLFILPLFAFRYGLAPHLARGGASRALALGAEGIGFLAQVFLIYAPLLYLSFRSGVGEALKASFAFARRHFWVSFGIVLIPYLLARLISLPLKNPKAITDNFAPELVLWLLLFSTFATLFVLFLQLSTLVRFYADEMLRRPFEGEWDDKHARP